VLTKIDLAIVAEPLRWVTVAGVNVRKRDGEVNEVEIEVLKTPVFELFLRSRLGLHIETHLTGVTLDREKTPHDHGRGMCSRASD
jgi:hypothetical protein